MLECKGSIFLLRFLNILLSEAADAPRSDGEERSFNPARIMSYLHHVSATTDSGLLLAAVHARIAQDLSVKSCVWNSMLDSLMNSES